MKKVFLLFLTLVLLLGTLCGCTETMGVTPACVGYSAGNEEKALYDWHAEDRRTVPAEFVRSFALYTALTGGADLSKDTSARIIFAYSTGSMKELADAVGGREALLSEMNVLAGEYGLKNTFFGSISGTEKSEGAIGELYGTVFMFNHSYSTLGDLQKMAALFAERPEMTELLSKLGWKFAGEGTKYRTAQLLRKDSEFYLENVEIYLAGSVLFEDGSTEYIAITVLKNEGARGISAVAERSGNDPVEMFAACDGANLSGEVIGEHYNFIYHPKNENTQGRLFIGADLFVVVIVLLAVFLVGMILLMVIVGFVTTAKRNADARKKYCSDKKEE